MKSGMKTIFFIPFDKKPKHKKATYLRIVAAFRPENLNPTVYDAPLAATVSITLETKAVKLPI